MSLGRSSPRDCSPKSERGAPLVNLVGVSSDRLHSGSCGAALESIRAQLVDLSQACRVGIVDLLSTFIVVTESEMTDVVIAHQSVFAAVIQKYAQGGSVSASQQRRMYRADQDAAEDADDSISRDSRSTCSTVNSGGGGRPPLALWGVKPTPPPAMHPGPPRETRPRRPPRVRRRQRSDGTVEARFIAVSASAENQRLPSGLPDWDQDDSYQTDKTVTKSTSNAETPDELSWHPSCGPWPPHAAHGPTGRYTEGSSTSRSSMAPASCVPSAASPERGQNPEEHGGVVSFPVQGIRLSAASELPDSGTFGDSTRPDCSSDRVTEAACPPPATVPGLDSRTHSAAGTEQ